jgi:uncharacterized protein YcnI
MRPTMRRSHAYGRLSAVLAAGVVFFAGAGAASAHIQVSPTVAAPGDSVKFTVLVPGETGQETTKIELQIPKGVLVFSFGETPGWERQVVEAADASVGSVVWTGRLAADGFAEFSFLAATPDQPGTLKWSAVQTYADGEVVRWIGEPGSEEPAAVTELAADAPRQNAGGEGDEATGGEGGGAAETTATEPSEPEAAPEPTAAAAEDDSGGTDWLARGLGLLALAAGIVAIAVAVRRREKGPPAEG